MAPLTLPKVVKGDRKQLGGERHREEERLSTHSAANPLSQLYSILSRFTKIIVNAIMGMVKGMAVMINSLYKKFLSSILRSAFGVTLVNSFYVILCP